MIQMIVLSEDVRDYYKLIQNALHVLQYRDNYCYFYGAKGQRLTDEVMDALIGAEPAYFRQYDALTLNAIKNYSRGKIGLDCSGFITYISGVQGYSVSLIESCPVKTTPDLGVEGSLLFTTKGGVGRHVGIDIGYGFFLHFPKEMRTCELGRIKDYVWEVSGQLKGIDYKGAKS